MRPLPPEPPAGRAHRARSLLEGPCRLATIGIGLGIWIYRRAGETDPPGVILKQLGLQNVADRYPRDLSSGERQRAALAAVLPGTPDLVLLDEPTRGMDAKARDALVDLVSALRDRGSAVVLATHDADLRAALADRVLHIDNGTVKEQKPHTVPA